MRDSSRPLSLSRRDALRVTATSGLVAVGCSSGKPSNETGDTDSGSVDTSTPVRSPEPAAWEPTEALDEERFPFGVQIGDVGPTDAIVHLRTFVEPVTLVVMEAQDDGWVEHQRHTDLRTTPLPVDAAPAGMAVRVNISGLSPDTAYSLVFVDGSVRSRVARFRTALGEGGWRVVTFGSTSCFGGNEPWPSLAFAAADQLDFFCLLGDTVYADGSSTVDDYRAFWDQALSTQGLVDVCASTSIIATWDDHEVDNNWSREEVGEEKLAIASACFAEALPRSEGPGGTGIWRSRTWGDVLEVFVLDGRGERDQLAGKYLSDAQVTWLLDSLRASTARFKIILNSVPITDLTAMFGAAGASDRWDGYPQTRSTILEAIASDDISGVLWVTGDVHYAQLGFVDPAGGVAAQTVEVFTGPVGSFLNIAADLFVGDPQYTWMASVWNWVRFTCDPGTGSILVEFVGDDGSILYASTVSL